MDNAKLMAMLSGAKNVMDKVETGNYEVDHVALHETIGNHVGSGELLVTLPEGAVAQQNAARPMGNTYKNLETSKMPDAIKQAMINNPIPKQQMGSGGGPTFSLEDVKGLVKSAPQQAVPAQYAPQQVPVQQMNETKIVNSQGKMLITMTEAELDKKIQDALLEFMTKTFTKTLTEGAIKKTITTLIKEGKIKIKPKTAK